MAAPQMRGLVISKLKRDLVITAVISTACVLGYKYGIQNPRIKRYEEFQKYDLNLLSVQHLHTGEYLTRV